MGLLGKLIGWDQQKDAWNAVLASNLVGNSSPELRRVIAERLILIQQQMRGHGAGAPSEILADLSSRSRMVQMNFVALACNSLGIPASIGVPFAEVNNPYQSDSESSRARIGSCIKSIQRSYKVIIDWPGNEKKENFINWLPANEENINTESEEISLPEIQNQNEYHDSLLEGEIENVKIILSHLHKEGDIKFLKDIMDKTEAYLACLIKFKSNNFADEELLKRLYELCGDIVILMLKVNDKYPDEKYLKAYIFSVINYFYNAEIIKRSTFEIHQTSEFESSSVYPEFNSYNYEKQDDNTYIVESIDSVNEIISFILPNHKILKSDIFMIGGKQANIVTLSDGDGSTFQKIFKCK